VTPSESRAAPPTAEGSSCRLLILDDFFPNQLSGFRIAEFNSLFRAFPDAQCASISADFPTARLAYAARYPEFANRVSVFVGRVPDATDLVYCVGLNTIEFYRPFLELQSVPFVLELYPGFGLRLNDRESNRRLDAAIGSKCFRKVIVTQINALEYVRRRYDLPASQLIYKYGFVADDTVWPDPPRRGSDDGRLELAFVAHNYTEAGRDKGYDVFIDSARRLQGSLPGRVRLHVVGSWGPSDYPLGALVPGRDIFFHGSRTQPFFRTLHQGIDAIVSPNRANMTGHGAFDGFPTASVVDAMMCGAAAFITDPLRLNHELRTNREFVLIEPDADSTAEAILRTFRSPGEMARIGERGRLAVRRLFSLESQMRPRIAALSTPVATQSARSRRSAKTASPALARR
jgi:glycosyltransferase involved in cell wall biosynthesis